MKKHFLKVFAVAAMMVAQGANAQQGQLPFKITLTALNQSTAYCVDQMKFDLLHQILNSDHWYDYTRNAVMQIDWMLGDNHMNYESTTIGAWARSKGVQGSVKLTIRQTNHVLDANGNPVATAFLVGNEGEIVSMMSIPSVTFNHTNPGEATDRLGRYDTDKIILSNVTFHEPVGYQPRMPVINRNRGTSLTVGIKDYLECMVAQTTARQLP